MCGVWGGGWGEDYCGIKYNHVTTALQRISVWVLIFVAYFKAILGYVSGTKRYILVNSSTVLKYCRDEEFAKMGIICFT